MMFYSIKQFADKIGVSEQTLRVWDKNGTLKPHHRTTGGHRVYSEDQIETYLTNGTTIKEKNISMTFCDGKLIKSDGIETLGADELQNLQDVLTVKKSEGE